MTKLRKMLMERNWSINELSRRSGVDKSIIYKYYHGSVVKPNDLTLYKFAKALNCNVEDVMEENLD